jgi:hypothetical protein
LHQLLQKLCERLHQLIWTCYKPSQGLLRYCQCKSAPPVKHASTAAPCSATSFMLASMLIQSHAPWYEVIAFSCRTQLCRCCKVHVCTVHHGFIVANIQQRESRYRGVEPCRYRAPLRTTGAQFTKIPPNRRNTLLSSQAKVTFTPGPL